LKEVAQDNDFQSYFYSAIGYHGRLLFLKGDLESGERLLRQALSKLSEARYENMYVPFLGHLAELLAADGRVDEGFLASTESLDRTKSCEAFWWLPDALRIHGEVLTSLEGSGSRSAEDYLRQSIELSKRQGGLGWQLRAARSLAELLHQQNRTDEAFKLLSYTLSKFTEGFETVPFRRTRALLEEMR
jgi:tetratricopeptide (TPR) repeat protein